MSLAGLLQRWFRKPLATGGAPRVLSYAPRHNRLADPGEIVWTSVAFEESPQNAKDRPVLVMGRAGSNTVHALMLSTQPHRDGQPHWMAIGGGAWDSENRASYVRLDRVLTLPADSIRREASVLDQHRFAVIATRLRDDYGWTW